MRYFYLFIFLVLFIFIGAGCANGPQAEIPSPVLGKDDAPVEITEFFDYQCPACKAAEYGVISFIISDYVDTGKVKIVFKNMAFLGPESRLAANAALCAAEGGKFLDYHKKLYEIQGAKNSGVYTKTKLKEIAAEVGLDAASFEICVDSERYRLQVVRETQEAGNAGVRATPTYIINSQLVQGGTFLSIKRVIDKKLEEAGK